MLLQRASQLWRFAKFGLPLSRIRPETPRTIADVIEEQAAARARHPFVIFEGRTLTYDESLLKSEPSSARRESAAASASPC